MADPLGWWRVPGATGRHAHHQNRRQARNVTTHPSEDCSRR
ncbi:MAG: hypothetical protein KTV45_15965 [Acidimicrobiia bacterium]|nr:hypothetical protein [Acidimicrobiia bacterium]